MIRTIEIDAEKRVFVAWTNSDLTEGRGQSIPLAVCDKESTAIRLGKGKSVQGCNCDVTEEMAIKVKGNWLAPARIVSPTAEDVKDDLNLQAYKSAKAKAEEAGLTAEDIKALSARMSV